MNASPVPGLRSPTAKQKSPAPSASKQSSSLAMAAQVAQTLGKQHRGDGLARSYNAEEDVKIYELFSNKPIPPAGHKSKGQPSPLRQFNNQKAEWCKEAGRSQESVRDRFKKYLKYLSDDDIERIRNVAGDKLKEFYLCFERVADEKDAHAKRLRDITREEPRPVAPPSSKGGKKKPEPASASDILSKRRLPLEEGGESGSQSRKVHLRQRNAGDEDWDYDFDVREYVPHEYFTHEFYIPLTEVTLTPFVKGATRGLADCLLSCTDAIQVAYNGKDFDWTFIKKPGIREMSKVLGGVAQLMGVDLQEAEKIYAGVSFDMADLKAYIGGNKRLLWSSFDDLTLQSALNDKKSFERFYPHLVSEKGEESVKKRIEFLKHGGKQEQ